MLDDDQPKGTYDWIRVSQNDRCPICGAADWCGVTSDGALCHCMRTESERPSAGGGWLHLLADPRPRSRPRLVIPTAPSGDAAAAKLSPITHDRIARELQRLLHLDEPHRQALRARGMDDAMIARRGYRSLTKLGIGSVMRQLCEAACAAGDSVDDVLRFPGVQRRVSKYGPYLTLAARPALMIPVRDVEGRIAAYRLRPDDAGDGGKYRWLSTPNGPSPGAPVHVARPAVVRDPLTIWVTEGELKADIAAELLGVVVLSIPGATITAAVPGIIQELARMIGAVLPAGALAAGAAGLNVVLAFDSDKHDPRKPSVLMGERRLAHDLARVTGRVCEATWAPEHGKGLDDLLVGPAGVQGVRTNPYPFPRPAAISIDSTIDTARMEASANAAWSVDVITAGVIQKSEKCRRGRMFFMNGAGRISNIPWPCGKWTCGECAEKKLRTVTLPHLVGLLKGLDSLWVGTFEGSDDAFRQCVCRLRKDGGHPKYVKVKRQLGFSLDYDIVDFSDTIHIVATENIGGQLENFSSEKAYQQAKETVFLVPGITKITFCEAWRLPKDEKPKCHERLLYSSVKIVKKRFEELADEAFLRWYIRPVYEQDIPHPEVRKFIHEGLNKLRSGDNSEDWSDLSDEEHDG